MVQQALNRHSRIVIPPETKFFFSLLGQSHRRQLRHLDRLNADLGVNLPRPARRVRSVDEARGLYEDMARQYVGRLGRQAAAYFGEKTPEHTGHLPLIRRLFPEAKILVLYRDGRDVAASLRRMPWMSPDLYVCFLVWLYYDRVVREAQRGGCPGMTFARYEHIVADPEKEFARILRDLDLPYEPAVAEGWGNTEGVPEREYPWKRRALEKITPERVGAFRRELSPEQIETLERLGRHALPTLGYELITGGNKPLSSRLLLSLLCETSRLVYRLPWRSLLNELISRSSRPGPWGAPCSLRLIRPDRDPPPGPGALATGSGLSHA
jgi:hypothetical protein